MTDMAKDELADSEVRKLAIEAAMLCRSHDKERHYKINIEVMVTDEMTTYVYDWDEHSPEVL